jgi:hypothetical protein
MGHPLFSSEKRCEWITKLLYCPLNTAPKEWAKRLVLTYRKSKYAQNWSHNPLLYDEYYPKFSDLNYSL